MVPQLVATLDSRHDTRGQERPAAARRKPGSDRDGALIQALRRGALSATEQLIAAYGDRAYRLAIRITGNGQDAEEVVQDACWAVVRKIDSFRGDAALGSWIYRIVANAAYQKLRERRRRRRVDLSLEEVLPVFDQHGRHVAPIADWSGRLEDDVVQTELRIALTAAIDELPAAYRTVLVLRDVEGQSNHEIATALGLSVAGVKTRVHRARLFLRKRLDHSMTTIEATATTACAS